VETRRSRVRLVAVSARHRQRGTAPAPDPGPSLSGVPFGPQAVGKVVRLLSDRQRLQREILDRFPNVQIFDVADIVSAVQKIINNFVLAISFVGGFVILCGILILIGSVALTKSQRIYENAVLKTLGASRATLVKILFAEYGILGLLAGMIGAVFSTALSFAVSRYILDIEWEFSYAVVIAGILITAVLVMLIGVAASFDVLFRKPLVTLRSQ